MGRTGQQMRQRTKTAMAQGGATRTPTVRAAGRWDRLHYWFDNSMSRGTPALVAWLAIATLVLIIVFSVFVAVFNLASGSPDFGHQLLNSLFHSLDPGTVAGDGGASWRYIFTMLALTVAGLFIVSALIGVIATGIDAKLSDLRRGRSVVIEKDHTVILGWSDAVFTIVSELAIANESRRRAVIVVLADRDKVEMEDELREKVPDLHGTKVICRSGSPIDLGDLELCSHHSARSVIVLSPGGDDPDSEVIKTLLALTHAGDGPPIVAEIQDPQNLEAARMVGRERAVLVDKRETVARLIVQTSRQSGAAAVYTELFDFDGDEIYFHTDAALAGSTYGETLLAFEDVTVIGLLDQDGVARLNPPQDTVVGSDELIVVVEDDSALTNAGRSTATVDDAVISGFQGRDETPSHALLIGWNERAAAVVRELDAYAEPGSELVILTEFGVPVLPALVNLTATIERGRTTDRTALQGHVRGDLNQVIVLCYSEQFPTQQADARTLVTLLHVREIIGDEPGGPAVVSEMLDDRNRALAEVAHVDDVIVSDQILSLMLSQLSEDARLASVFADLLDADGAEIYLRPVEWYVTVGEQASFATIVGAAARRGETALGYRSIAQSRSGDGTSGVRINPAKSELFAIEAGDRVVVLAED
ncbi:MAG: TrkA-N domain protein [Marmoricola sp.]|jgi:voltage-gated potassium channel Kch|nr:TrkA-N domain protein [Marmoricola sp.]